MTRWRWLAVLVAAAIAAGASYALWRGPEVSAVRAARKDVVQSVVASGRIATQFRVDIGSQIVGTVGDVPVAEGQAVRAGQVLIRVGSAEARANLLQAQASHANAQ